MEREKNYSYLIGMFFILTQVPREVWSRVQKFERVIIITTSDTRPRPRWIVERVRFSRVKVYHRCSPKLFFLLKSDRNNKINQNCVGQHMRVLYRDYTEWTASRLDQKWQSVPTICQTRSVAAIFAPKQPNVYRKRKC